MCSLALDGDTERLRYIATQEERAKKLAENLVKDEECWVSARKNHQRSVDYSLKNNIPLILVFDVGTVGFSWLVVWIVILVVRWVQRGFASA